MGRGSSLRPGLGHRVLRKLFKGAVSRVTTKIFPSLSASSQEGLVSVYFSCRGHCLRARPNICCRNIVSALGRLTLRCPLFVMDGYRYKCVRIVVGNTNVRPCVGSFLYFNRARASGSRAVLGLVRGGGLASPICIKSARKSTSSYGGTNVPFVFTTCNLKSIGRSCPAVRSFSRLGGVLERLSWRLRSYLLFSWSQVLHVGPQWVLS